MSAEEQKLRDEIQNQSREKPLNTIANDKLLTNIGSAIGSEQQKMELPSGNLEKEIFNFSIVEVLIIESANNLRQAQESQQHALCDRLKIAEREFQGHNPSNNEDTEIDSEEQIVARLLAEEVCAGLDKRIEDYKLDLFEINRIKTEREIKNQDEAYKRSEAEKLVAVQKAAEAAVAAKVAAKTAKATANLKIGYCEFDGRNGYDSR